MTITYKARAEEILRELRKLNPECIEILARMRLAGPDQDDPALRQEIEKILAEAKDIEQLILDSNSTAKQGFNAEAKRQLESVFARKEQLETDFSNLRKEISGIKTTVTRHGERLNGLEGAAFNVYEAVGRSRFDDAQFRYIFVLDPDSAVDINDFAAGTAARLTHQQEEIRTIKDDMEKLDTYVESEFMSVREQIQTSSSPNKTPLIIGAVVFVLAYLLVYLPFLNRPNLEELLLALATGGLICGLLVAFGRSKSKTTTTEVTTETTSEQSETEDDQDDEPEPDNSSKRSRARSRVKRAWKEITGSSDDGRDPNLDEDGRDRPRPQPDREAPEATRTQPVQEKAPA